MAIAETELRELVDWESGLISPRIFIDDDIYQLELERLFGRTWLFLAHDTMIPKPGDFFSTYMGGDPVIVSRQKDGSVKAFLNVCRHRGMKVCRAEEGNTNAFMCTYHGWTYDGSGGLVSVPNFEDAYYGELDASKWGLVQIRVESYKGLWFGNFHESAPSLVDYLGDMTWFIDSWLDGTAEGIEVFPCLRKWQIKGNWKIAAEQFAGDSYHGQITHLSSFAGLGPGRSTGGQSALRQGHGTAFRYRRVGGDATDTIGRYKDVRQTEADERLGTERPVQGPYTVFPNFSGINGSNSFRLWQPKGPNLFEIWAWTFVDKSAPAEIKTSLRLYDGMRHGPAGVVESDDGENWNLIGEILTHGPQSRAMAWNYQMGLGHEHDDDPVFPGRIGALAYGDTPQRGFYRRWLEFLMTQEWPHVPTSELVAAKGA